MAYTEYELMQVFNLTDGRCFYCGRDLSYHAYQLFSERGAWLVDRFIPVKHGGQDSQGNLTACCPACSHEKGEQLPWEFDPKRFKAGVWEMARYLKKADEVPG